MVVQGIFVTLWSGKFPRTWCFVSFGVNTQKHINMNEWDFRGLTWDVGSRIQRKTTEKEAQMVVHHLFFDAYTGRKKTGTWHGWLRCPNWFFWGCNRQKKGCKSMMWVYIKKSRGKIYATRQKITKTSKLKLLKTKQIIKKNNRTKYAKKNNENNRNFTKRIALSRIKNISSVKRKKTWIARSISRQNRSNHTDKTCKTIKQYKYEKFGKKKQGNNAQNDCKK